jgi:hypothetical protein
VGELPVICGSSSLKPEVAASGFSLSVQMELQNRCMNTRSFFKLQSTLRKLKRKDRRQLHCKSKALHLSALTKI